MKKLFCFPLLLLFAFSVWSQTTVKGPVTIKGPVTVAATGMGSSTFVGQSSCTASTGGACTVTSLSIPSGDIIGVVGNGAGTVAIADSNSDTPFCAALVTEVTNNNTLQLCGIKAGATITTVTCTPQFSGIGTVCLVTWYTPGSLAGVKDQSTGQDQPNATTWTTGATATLSGSTDLVLSAWGTNSNLSATSTYSDGSTQRVLATNAVGVLALADRNVIGTSAVTASGTFTPTGQYAAVAVLAVK